MIVALRISIALVLLASPLLQAAQPCPPAAYSRQALLALRETGFVIPDADQRNVLALALLPCVGDPDPAIRDGVVFEGLSSWLRQQSLESTTIHLLLDELLKKLSAGPDPDGFLRPFAALILSEVARADRMDEQFTAQQRQQLAEFAAVYLTQVSDYRGFSDTEGWRHGVAHGADLALQLALNEHINAAQLDQLITAVFSQVVPTAGVFYVYGESNRLARAAFYAWRRSVLDESRWKAWIEAIADPSPLNSWNEAYASEAGLARRHNSLAFLAALYIYTSTSGDTQDQPLTDIVINAIGKLW